MLQKRTDSSRICIVGSGTRFLSGISYYTIRLANSLTVVDSVAVILMRQLLPTFLYPGRKRVGSKLTHLRFDSSIKFFDGVDWYWLPSIVKAAKFLVRSKPEFIIFQWWTGTVLHSYLALALIAKMIGARVIIEFHEVLDPGEAGMAPVSFYVNLFLPSLIKLASGYVIHSEYDRNRLEKEYKVRSQFIELIHLGPYNHYQLDPAIQVFRDAPISCCNLLFFGVIRPFKGLEDLICAFEAIPEQRISEFWLTVVGETWEGWTLPARLISKSKYCQRMTFINRYVKDEEVAAIFGGADAVVLPYHRSSASGPLHISMSLGLPVIVTDVGGLREAVADYKGVILVPPRNPMAIQEAILRLKDMAEKRFPDPHSWECTKQGYERLFQKIQEVHSSPRGRS